MKKSSAILLVSVLLLSTIASACSKEQADGPKQNEVPSIVTPAGTLPITTEKSTLRILVAGRQFIDFPTSSATKWLEDKTNVHIEWEIAPEGKEMQTKLNVVLASGDYPDVIMNFNVSNAQQMNYGRQGVFIPLNSLIDKYGVEMKKNVFDKFPSVREDITAPDKNIYSLPVVSECYQCSMGQKMWIYKPWLDKLGLKVPTTTDEFYQTMKAFKEKDPNGNGKADEIPMSGSIEGDHMYVDEFLMNAFVLNSVKGLTPGFSIEDGQHMYLDKGKVVAAFNQPGWKEGLKYLNKLYSEKLLDPQAFTQNRKQITALGENPEIPILGASGALGFGQFTAYGSPSGRWKDYVPVPPLKGPTGFQVAPYYPDVALTGSFIITKAAKHPDVAMRLADFLYSEEAKWRMQKGEEGVNWRKPLPGELGANGKPAVFAQLNPIAQEKSNNSWYQRGVFVGTDAERYTSAVDPKAQKAQPVILMEATRDLYEPYKQKADTMIPMLFMSEDQSKRVVDFSKTIGTYVDEMLARFVTGDLDIDKNWDSYLKQLNDMNLPKLLAAYQEAYDAKYKK